MIRIEIIANRSVEENLLEAFRNEGVAKFYTKYPNVLGVGSTGPRMGDAVWPEENFALVIWCERDEISGIERALSAVKKQFPDEGIKLFLPEGTPAIPGPAPAELPELPPAEPEPAEPPPPEPEPMAKPAPSAVSENLRWPKPVSPPLSYGPEAENS
jgi:hypothetical protein